MWVMTVIAGAIDVLLIATFLAFVITFLKNGFARTIYKIGKTWLSVVCSMMLGPWVSKLLQDLFLRRVITNGIYSALDNLVQNNANDYNLQQLFENLPESFTTLIGNYGVSFEALEHEFGSATQATPAILQTIAERLATPCIDITSSIIGHAVGFIVPLLFFGWLNLKIKRTRNTFFRVIDRISGLFAGVAVGYVAVVAISVALQTIFQIIVAFDMNNPVVIVYERSWVFRFFSNFDTIAAFKKVLQGLLG